VTVISADPISRETDGRSADRSETRLATRLAFLIAGFGLAAWAPLVPYARERAGVDNGTLGLLLLFLGVGSLVAMPMTGILSARFGSKPIIISGALGMVLFLPLLTVAGTPSSLGIALLAFGASLGSLDVAMNIHAVEVEKAAHSPLMSGFHALFSIGGFAGALLMTFLLMLQTPPLIATLLCALVMLISTTLATPRLLRQTGHQHGPLFEVPRGIVVILAGLTAITFLVEGAMLDWSALLLTSKKIVQPDRAGFGYVLFAIAMTTGRLCGDVLTGKLGDRRTLLWGGIAAVAGFAVLLAPISVFALSGFLLIGGGASNLVPVLFRHAGSQAVMPPGLAIAAISTTGYAGILVGPAGVGFLAKLVGLPTAFFMLALLLSLVPLCAWIVTGKRA
jgi:predicted MFS family arabinose efflux permease